MGLILGLLAIGFCFTVFVLYVITDYRLNQEEFTDGEYRKDYDED